MAENRNEKEVLLKVRTDTSEANSGLEEVRGKIEQANQSAKELSRVDYGSMSVKELKEELDKAEMSMEALARSGNATEGAMKVLGDRVDEINEGLNSIGTNKSAEKFEANMRVAIGAVESVGGALTFIGVESETANEALARMAGLMSFTNGIKDMVDYGQKVGITQRAVQGWNTIQEMTNTTLGRTKLALAGLGIGLITAAIAYLVTNWEDLVEIIGISNKEMRDASKAHDTLVESLNNGPYKQTVADIISLRTNLALAKDGFIDKDKVVKDFNNTIGKSIGELKTFDEVEKFIIDNSDDYIKAMLLRAAAMLAIEKAADAALKAELEFNKTDEESTDWIRSGYANSTDEGVQKIYRDRAKANREARASEAKEEQQQFEDIARDLLKQSSELFKKFDFTPSGKGAGSDFAKGVSEGIEDEFANSEVDDKLDEEFHKLVMKAVKNNADAKRLIREDNTEAKELELSDVREEYAEKIRIAKEAGLDTKALIEAQKIEEREIEKKYRDYELQDEAAFLEAKRDLNGGVDPENKEEVEAHKSEQLELLDQQYQLERELYKDNQTELLRLEQWYNDQKVRINEEASGKLKKIEDKRQTAIEGWAKATQTTLSAVSTFMAEDAKERKYIAAAQATIETFLAINRTLSAFAGKPIPGYAIAQAVATGVFGMAQVRSILSTNETGGGLAPTPPAGGRTAPVINTTILRQPDPTDINSLGDNQSGAPTAPIRAYIVDRDIQKSRSKNELTDNLSTF